MERQLESTGDLIRSQLRHLRTAAGLNQEEFGRQVHYSGSLVSAVELGTRPLDRNFLARADEVLKTQGLLCNLLSLAERDREPSWFRPWLDAERQAKQLRCFEPMLVPGLLQTPNYARAVLRTDDTLSDEEVDQLLAARLKRQEILEQSNPPQFVAVLDEAVLRRVGEDARAVMAEQVTHLIACSERPHISVHVIPTDVSMHVGLSGPFVLARTADGGWVGHLENQLGGVVVDGDDGVATLLARWETVRNEALPRRQSTDLMKEAVSSWISPTPCGARPLVAEQAGETASR